VVAASQALLSELPVGTPVIQVRFSINLDVHPKRREHSWDGYVRYTKVFIFIFISAGSDITQNTCVNECLAHPKCYTVYWYQGSSFCYNYNTTVQNTAFTFGYNHGAAYNHWAKACLV
jgi:hypothetical protein